MSVLTKAVQLIELLSSAEQPMKLGAISEALALPKSSAHRLLNELADLGIAARCPDGTYALGYRPMRWSQSQSVHSGLIASAEPIMQRLRDQTEYSVMLFVADGPERVCLAVANGTSMLRPHVPIGGTAVLGMGSGGRLLYALASDAVRQQVRAMTPDEQLMFLPTDAECAQMRARGWATSVDTIEPGLTGISAAIRDDATGVVAVLVVAGSSLVLTADRFDEVLPLLTAAAGEIGRAVLGERSLSA